MSGKPIAFVTHRQGISDMRKISPSPNRPDTDRLQSSFFAERGVQPGAMKSLDSSEGEFALVIGPFEVKAAELSSRAIKVR